MTTDTPTGSNLHRVEEGPAALPYAARLDLRHAAATVTAVEDLAQARVAVTATGPRAQQLADSVVVHLDEHGLVVEVPAQVTLLGLGGSVRLDVHVPADSDARVVSGSGGVDLRGRLLDVDARSGSGVLTLESAASAVVRSGSGRVRIDAVEDLSLTSGSGAVEVGRTGRLVAKSGSGSLRVGAIAGESRLVSGSGAVSIDEVSGDLELRAGSGAVRIGELTGRIAATTGSGSFAVAKATSGRVEGVSGSGSSTIGVPYGTAVLVDAESRSGRVRSELESVPGAEGFERTLEVHVRAGSGSVTLRRVS